MRINARLAPFGCHNCGKTLGWTSRGEAKSMNSRAHVFCETCKDLPQELTPRQAQVLTVLSEITARGERPTFTAVAAVMNLSLSRVQQLAQAIRARGYGVALDAALDGNPVAAEVSRVPDVVSVASNRFESSTFVSTDAVGDDIVSGGEMWFEDDLTT